MRGAVGGELLRAMLCEGCACTDTRRTRLSQTEQRYPWLIRRVPQVGQKVYCMDIRVDLRSVIYMMTPGSARAIGTDAQSTYAIWRRSEG